MNDPLLGQHLPPGIDPDAIGNAQLDDATLASEESDFNRRSKAVIREEQRLRVLEGKRVGRSFRAIGRELQISQAKAQRLFAEGMRLEDGLTLAQSRQLMLLRLEEAVELTYQKMVGDGTDLNLDGHRAWLATLAMICKVTGLDQHAQADGEDVGELDAETVDERLAAAFLRAGARVPDSLQRSMSFARAVHASRKAVEDGW